uniref:Cystatin domain-containing protein n=1 Tax=Panagrellus redivivus TaxID=6233 RepID=A0A7E4W3N1_PANRE
MMTLFPAVFVALFLVLQYAKTAPIGPVVNHDTNDELIQEVVKAAENIRLKNLDFVKDQFKFNGEVRYAKSQKHADGTLYEIQCVFVEVECKDESSCTIVQDNPKKILFTIWGIDRRDANNQIYFSQFTYRYKYI